MKQLQTLASWTLLPLLVLGGSACRTTEGGKPAEHNSQVNLAPADGPRGYVDFYTTEVRNGVAIYRLQVSDEPRLLGVVGVAPGTHYLLDARDRKAPVAETLRVSAAPGVQTFQVERDGRTFQVPIVADKVTPVEVHYVLKDRVSNYDVFRVNTRVLEPVNSEAERTSSE